ncbi:MAG: TraB/GumN family protein [Hyphomicrobiales bacterium]|nr:TraB/GumN family protein [Hyphomicrobiales bacterium]
MAKSWTRLTTLLTLMALVGWQAVGTAAPARARPAAPAATAAARIEPGLLWAVSRDGRLLGHLFGTFHLPVAPGTTHGHRLAGVVARVEPVLARARTAAFEIDMAATDPQAAARRMFFQDGRRLDGLLPADVFAQARDRLVALGMPVEAVAHMKPWAVAVTLTLPEAREAEPMDSHLQAVARDAGAAIVGLETMDEQLGLFDALPMDKQVGYANLVVRGGDRLAEAKARMIDSYVAGDLEKTLAITEEVESAEEAQFATWFKDLILGRRNQRMAERIRGLLADGGLFVAVGALHLPGPEGLVNLLRRAGYDLRPVK